MRHIELGSSLLGRRGSGGARLAVASEPIRDAARVEAAGRELSAYLAVRSSSPLETDGEWAGAFTSYVAITPEELPKAVAGCWASAFTVDALERQLHAGIEPGTVPMAVLVQPSIDPTLGGVAEISPDGTLRVEAVAGSPARLLQGWERGVAATRRSGEGWEGAGAVAVVGTAMLDEIGAALGEAWRRFGFTRCEWGVAGSLSILQLGRTARREPTLTPARTTTSAALIPVVQALMATPGALGRELVLPWAVSGLPVSGRQPVGGGDLLDLSTPELRAALDRRPVTAPGRVGTRTWEPLAAAVVLDHGVSHQGVAAAAGIGVGLRHHSDGRGGNAPLPRAVVTAPVARPDLSQLIWDAGGLVTDLGGPAAHVFETARSLGVPAVCGVDLGSKVDQIVAVDGYSGVVSTLPLA
jgi:phosphohistidine swiveling domain-containing protein